MDKAKNVRRAVYLVFRLLYLSDQIIQSILVVIEQLFTINKSDTNPEISSILYDKLHPIVGPLSEKSCVYLTY